MLTRSLVAATLALPLATSALAETHAGDKNGAGYLARVEKADGNLLNTVSVAPTASGMMLVEIDLTGMPPGVHAVHLHETGDCSAPDFKSAGGHIAGDRTHGVETATGPHPGDLPNVHVGESGRLSATQFNGLLTGAHLSDADGAAFVVHSGADDYESQPAGDAGARIACGVFEPEG